MRLRWQRRVRKQLKRLPELSRDVAALEKLGRSLTQTLHAILTRPGNDDFFEGHAGSLLSIAGDTVAVDALLHLFFSRTEKAEILAIANRLHVLNDKRAVRPLIQALLVDPNPHRRHGAARALGWIRNRGRTATLALVRCLADRSQPLAAREEAADSIGFLGGTPEPVEALLSALDDPSALVRFRAVTGLGNYLNDSTVARALESMLDDSEVPPDAQCWSVGKEALRLLRNTERYRDRCETDAARILKNPNATKEDRRWAGSYGE